MFAHPKSIFLIFKIDLPSITLQEGFQRPDLRTFWVLESWMSY